MDNILTPLAINKETWRRMRPKKILFPKREPSIVVPPKSPVFITADKTTCIKCGCFPVEDRFAKNKCLTNPLTLYELAASVVDSLPHPEALTWRTFDVVNWMSKTVGLPQYKMCIIDNKIYGMKLLMLEDPSNLPKLNIHDFHHIKQITSHIRKLYGTDFIQFIRSVSLPFRRPSVHCTWFKSRTGPSWRNWTSCDILRWMSIIMPKPVRMNHWDLVWHLKRDFPKVMFARVEKAETEPIPLFRDKPDKSGEYLVRRKFIITKRIPEDKQWIWAQRMSFVNPFRRSLEMDAAAERIRREKASRLHPKWPDLNGLRGDALILAKRRMPKQKFFGGM